MQQLPPYIKSSLPEGCSGDWSIEKFTVQSTGQSDHRPACFQSPAGTYTRLKKNNEVFMTDLYDEWWTQHGAIEQARLCGGNVLITGLGLGLVVTSILESPDCGVKRVFIIERSADVIELVAPRLQRRYNGQIEVINADAYKWLPPPRLRFDVAWHDIWPNPHEPGLLAQAERLERRYASCCAWQGNWVRDYLAVEESEKIARAGIFDPASGQPPQTESVPGALP
jgi:hypothetical protein